ncbi:FeoA family protein [Calidifontibacillus erzurumensis]|uniref:Ferrous iron transport protein A n=1 Tax=Calidifontibacillus erzurumensis TaxID=2741433 RepID=A0A8J8GFS0_9BACI|nr:FeoA family protein [Calidifontibacillus erzurumensis]NSL51500.1 ferrous iron transport protein A [Calidifontibacillus erzurumensis]
MVLSDLQQGEKARIQDFSNVSELVKRRLIDMGINEGVEIHFKNKMPFGGPCMIEISGQYVGIRHQEAALIRVEKA